MKKTTDDDMPYNGRTAGRHTSTWRLAGPPDPPERAVDGDRADGGSPAGPLTGPTPTRLTREQGVRLAILAVTLVLLAAGTGLLGALLWPKTYAARAEILYPITQEQPTGFLREDRSMTTQLVLMQGRPVLAPVATEHGRTVGDLQEHITATVLDSSEIIELQVTDSSPDTARQIAQAVVDSYLRVNQTAQPLMRERLAAEIDAATTEVSNAQTRLATQRQQVSDGDNSLIPLQADLRAKQTRLDRLQSQLESLNQEGLSPVAQLLTPPYDAGTVSPSPGFAATAGALVGVVLAAGVVAIRARAWTRK